MGGDPDHVLLELVPSSGLGGGVAVALLIGGCVAPDEPRTADTFDDVFSEVRRFVLEEPAELPLGTIAAFDVAPDGRLIVADRQEVRVHDGEGRFLHRFGRQGGGPAEFGAILDVAAGADRVWIADATRDRIGVFDAIGGEAGGLSLPGGRITSLDLIDDRLLVRTSSRTEPRFTVLSAATGEVVARFLTEDSALVAIPYWGSILNYPAVAHAGGVAVAQGLRYPLLRFSLEGDSLGSFGSPPPSWRQAREPEYGEFAGPRQLELLAEYVETFTMIVRLDALDEALLVTHGRFEMSDRPGPPAHPVQTTLDVYDADGEKRHEDLALPGKIFGTSRDSLFILLAEPPEGWVIGVYRLRRGEGRGGTVRLRDAGVPRARTRSSRDAAQGRQFGVWQAVGEAAARGTGFPRTLVTRAPARGGDHAFVPVTETPC